jgi:hypothetical protein
MHLTDLVFAPHINRSDSTAQLSSAVVQTATQHRELWNLHLRLHAHRQFLARQS